MAAADLIPERMEAGKRYCAALERLGLELNLAMWVVEIATDRPLLLLQTHVFDYSGPLKMAEKLIAAYNSSDEFRDINPFEVMVRSTKGRSADSVSRSVRATGQVLDAAGIHPTGQEFTILGMKVEGFETHRDWILRHSVVKKTPTIEISRRWARFARNVDELVQAA